MKTNVSMGRLSEEQLSFLNENGYLRIQGVIDPWEVDKLDRATRVLIDYSMKDSVPNDDYQYATDPISGKRYIARINGTSYKGDQFYALYGHPGLLGIVESMFGPDLCSWRDDMVVKVPEYGAPVPWHRDPGRARIRPPMALDVYLDATTVENGCLHVVPGSHLWKSYDLAEMIEEHGFNIPGAIPVEAAPGDVVIHNPMVLHASRTVRGTRLRRIIYLAFFAVDEMQAQGWSTSYIKSWLVNLESSIRFRANLPETAGEEPYRLAHTLPELKVGESDFQYFEKRIKMIHPMA